MRCSAYKLKYAYRTTDSCAAQIQTYGQDRTDATQTCVPNKQVGRDTIDTKVIVTDWRRKSFLLTRRWIPRTEGNSHWIGSGSCLLAFPRLWFPVIWFVGITMAMHGWFFLLLGIFSFPPTCIWTLTCNLPDRYTGIIYLRVYLATRVFQDRRVCCVSSGGWMVLAWFVLKAFFPIWLNLDKST